tara:strand:- start:825 stop:1418 length:594 start_codon:yes stop_codon:yes gene_type:complete
METSDAMYFATQKFTDVNCVTLAINNLFGEPIVTRDSLLDMKIKNKKNRDVRVCQEYNSGGIGCQNQVIGHILKLIQIKEITVSNPIWTFFKNTSAVSWSDIKISTKISNFDTFFSRFQDHIVGIYGNRSFTNGIGHAVCVRRRIHGGPIWLLDSLYNERKRVSPKSPPVGKYKINPFVVILSHDPQKQPAASRSIQ